MCRLHMLSKVHTAPHADCRPTCCAATAMLPLLQVLPHWVAGKCRHNEAVVRRISWAGWTTYAEAPMRDLANPRLRR